LEGKKQFIDFQREFMSTDRKVDDVKQLLPNASLKDYVERYLSIAEINPNPESAKRQKAFREMALRFGHEQKTDKEEAIHLIETFKKPLTLFHHAVLGMLHSKIIKNPQQTFQHFQQAEEIPEGASNLGAMYGLGMGVAKDEKKAAELYQRASEKGYPIASDNLGAMYHYGQGVTKDLKKAAEYYQKGSEQGSAHASYYLGVMYHYGQGVTKDLKKAAEYYQKGSEQGSTHAARILLELAVKYQHGQGVTKDLKKAIEYYQKAQAPFIQNSLTAQMDLFLNHLSEKEALPKTAQGGFCAGFMFSLFRASAMGESKKHLDRLDKLAKSSPEQIIQTATIFNEYNALFKKLSENQKKELEKQLVKHKGDQKKIAAIRESHYGDIKKQAEKILEEEKKIDLPSLNFARELYQFIHLLIATQDPESLKLYVEEKDSKGAMVKRPIKQSDQLDLLKWLSSDEKIPALTTQGFYTCLFKENDKEQLIKAIDTCIFKDDIGWISLPEHVVFFSKHGNSYQLYDSNNKEKLIVECNTSKEFAEELIKSYFLVAPKGDKEFIEELITRIVPLPILAPNYMRIDISPYFRDPDPHKAVRPTVGAFLYKLIEIEKSIKNISNIKIALLNSHRQELVDAIKDKTTNLPYPEKIMLLDDVINKKNALGQILATPRDKFSFLFSKKRVTNSIFQLMEFKKSIEQHNKTEEKKEKTKNRKTL